MKSVTAEELSALDGQFSVEDWVESIKWLDEHGFVIIEKEVSGGGV